MDNKKTICAVIVTFNRKESLVMCLEALSRQTYHMDAVYVIDNASTDGTQDFLKGKGYIREDGAGIHYVRMHENTGGAGGFSEGMKRGYEDGYDFLWLMDDDGEPDNNCLEKLLETYYKTSANFVGALVVSKDDENELSFNLYDFKKRKSNFKQIDLAEYEKDGYVELAGSPFNGILVARELMKSIGFPKKEMFFLGDEFEYFLRAARAGHRIVTSTSAILRHPKIRSTLESVIFGRAYVIYFNNKLRDYCFFRNNAYIFNHYKIKSPGKIGASPGELLKMFIKYSWFFLINRKLDVKGLWFFTSASIDGLRENFGKHMKYLQSARR